MLQYNYYICQDGDCYSSSFYMFEHCIGYSVFCRGFFNFFHCIISWTFFEMTGRKGSFYLTLYSPISIHCFFQVLFVVHIPIWKSICFARNVSRFFFMCLYCCLNSLTASIEDPSVFIRSVIKFLLLNSICCSSSFFSH